MNPKYGWFWAPLIAVQFLTRIPLRFIPDAAFDAPADGRRKSVLFFPLVGLIVGGFGAVVWRGANTLHLPLLAVAVLTVAATAMITGAFHEDGLADTADALGPHDRAKSLEVMRDSRIGTFGAVALWAVLSLKAAALMTLPSHSVWHVLLAAHLLARWSSLPLAYAMPDARGASGLGVGLTALISPTSLLAATLLTLIGLGLLVGRHAGSVLLFGTLGIMLLTGLFYQNRFGGITGDCLGATNQIVETLVLLIASGLPL